MGGYCPACQSEPMLGFCRLLVRRLNIISVWVRFVLAACRHSPLWRTLPCSCPGVVEQKREHTCTWNPKGSEWLRCARFVSPLSRLGDQDASHENRDDWSRGWHIRGNVAQCSGCSSSIPGTVKTPRKCIASSALNSCACAFMRAFVCSCTRTSACGPACKRNSALCVPVLDLVRVLLECRRSTHARSPVRVLARHIVQLWRGIVSRVRGLPFTLQVGVGHMRCAVPRQVQ